MKTNCLFLLCAAFSVSCLTFGQNCPNPPKYDFGFKQNICDPLSVQFNANVSNVLSYEWSFGNGQKDAINPDPTLMYNSYGTYNVKLKVRYNNTCYDSLIKSIVVNNSYDKDLILNNDTSICSGDSVLIRSAESNTNFCWQTSSGNHLPASLAAYVKPDKSTTYNLQVAHKGDNLVSNGDFTLGNSGFSSEYQHSGSGFSAGVYDVGSNIIAWHPCMVGCNDHTTGNGNMMMVNGADQLNVNVWSQTIAVNPNTSYIFSAWLQTITIVNPAQLQFSINGVPIGKVFNADAKSCVWRNFYETWNSGSSTVATISIVNMSPEYSGNDFALDDIFFGEYAIKNDSVKITVNPLPDVKTVADAAVCAGESYTLNTTGAATYSWSPGTELSNATISNPVATPSATATYIVTGTDQNGCKAKDTVALTVNQCTTVTASFTGPDTVCVNTPVALTNTSVGASSYYWNFCVASMDAAPTATNIGNPGGLSNPVFIDYAFYNGNYYGFLINYTPGRLIRLDFGNSLLNNPKSIDMGNFGGIIPPGSAAEGIQVVHNEGKWYAIVVGGNPAAGNTPRILKIEFGADLTNTSPVATSWGNLGNMLQPIDLHVFQEGNNWYGFTVNAENNSITRFNFTNSFDNTPTAISLGNIGNLKYPTGIYSINDNGFWRVFIVNGGNNTRQSSECSLTRLDFGSSLLNTPTGVNLGNPGNRLQHPRDLTIMKLCNEIIGFAVNGDPNYNDIVKLNFNNDLSATPSISSLGNIGSLNFPHSISKLFRVDNDVYGFITNVANNTITRIRFNGCSDVNTPNSTLQNPPPVVYQTSGTYNINLTIDDGLPTQAAICKQVVVLPELKHTSLTKIFLCKGDSLKIGRKEVAAKFAWNTGEFSDSILINQEGIYWVDMSRFGCTNRDSFQVIFYTRPSVKLAADTTICEGSSILLVSEASGSNTYSWFPATDLSDASVSSPTAKPKDDMTYVVTATNSFNCFAKDTINIIVQKLPVVQLGNDTAFCKGDSLRLNASNANSTFQWQDSFNQQTRVVKDSGFYNVKVANNGCSASDTIHIAFHPQPVFHLPSDTAVCQGQQFSIATQAAETYSYQWFPENGLSDVHSPNPVVTVSDTINYIVAVTNSFQCYAKDSIKVFSLNTPWINLGADTTICHGETLMLDAKHNSAMYNWSNGVSTKTNNVDAGGVYSVLITKDGCSARDTIKVAMRKPPVFTINRTVASVCKNDTLMLQAAGGDGYNWYNNDAPMNEFNSDIIVRPATASTYSVKILESYCGFSDSLVVSVSVKPEPGITLSKSNDVTCAEPKAQLKAVGAVSYKWTPSTTMNSTYSSNPTVTPLTDTWYKVVATGTNGCTALDSIKVNVKFEDAGKFYVPNAFTPNGDGRNDCFGVNYWGPSETFELSVFNRWGQRVFNTLDMKICWDGKYKGVLQPNEVFVYYIKTTGACGTAVKKGTVVLIR